MTPALTAIAQAQDGAWTWRQAVESGYAPSTVSDLVTRGEWLRLQRRVYADAAVAPAPRRAVRAALLSIGPAATASHVTAAQLWRLELARSRPTLHVTVPVSRTRAHARGVVVHRAWLTPGEVADVGLPVSTPVRTVLDLARSLPMAEAVATGDSALRAGLVRAKQLEDAVSALAGTPAARTARDVVGLLDPAAGSVLESLLRVTLHQGGLPSPRTQYVVRDADGRFTARVDFAYPAAGLVLEADGLAHHGSREQFVADRRRQNLLVHAGWRVLRFSYADIAEHPDRVVAEVRAALAAAA